ncbi:plasmid mobilization protein [Escherichia coli]|nr:plasmid mobilization protein [Escherichia coli]
MRLKFIRRDRGSFSGGLLPFLPVCCRDRAERVLAVRPRNVMFNMNIGQIKKPSILGHR